MLTADIKVNGDTVGHLYAHNTSPVGIGGVNEYEFAYCRTIPYGKVKAGTITGKIEHDRSGGIEALVAAILNTVSDRLSNG